MNFAFSFGVISEDKESTAIFLTDEKKKKQQKNTSHLRHKQHAVGGYCADENGTSHCAVDQVGPGLQENGNGYSHGRGDGNHCDNGQDGGRLVDWGVADVTGQSSQIGPIQKKTALYWHKKKGLKVTIHLQLHYYLLLFTF